MSWRKLIYIPLVAFMGLGPSAQASELEAYLNSSGSGLADNLVYAVQDGIVAEILSDSLSVEESQGRCLNLMQDLGQAPLGVAVRAVVIVSGLGSEEEAIYSCF